ncbi:MAG TPA: TonB family protein [Candidatus Acidoferrales bacterium]|nr:TonB family protein [Candidatus Acidoferrales bacterium]
MQLLPEDLGLPEESGRFGALSMGVRWESSWQQFRTSLRSFVRDPRAPKTGPFTGAPWLCIHWVEGKFPGRAFTAAALWHVAAIWVLVLPIWGFLPKPQPTLAPIHIELTFDPTTTELPHISLPAPILKPKPAPEKPEEAPKPVEQRGADAFHPRQTILSIPVKITHPRQTLVQPEAPAEAPKIVTQLPNMVEWAATSPAPKPEMKISPQAEAPTMKRREVRDVAAPDIPNEEKNPGVLNIATSPAVNPAPRLALNPTTAPIAKQRRTSNQAAPEISPEVSAGDSSIRRVVALSTDPAPPAPVVEVPRGNLAARIAISPEGKKPGTPGGAEKPANGGGTHGGMAGAANGVSTSGGERVSSALNSLPAAVSISGGTARPSRRLNLNPSLPDRPERMDRRTGPSVNGTIDPNIAPDKILSGKEVYTMHIDMPNLTSVTGSWILNFAELNEEMSAETQGKGRLAAPILERKVDPEYPPAAIKAHIEGQVILYAIIRKDGTVDSIQRVRGLDPQLDKNAMTALAQWKFQPATRGGVPVDIEAVVYIPFRYRAPLD